MYDSWHSQSANSELTSQNQLHLAAVKTAHWLKPGFYVDVHSVLMVNVVI